MYLNRWPFSDSRMTGTCRSQSVIEIAHSAELTAFLESLRDLNMSLFRGHTNRRMAIIWR